MVVAMLLWLLNLLTRSNFVTVSRGGSQRCALGAMRRHGAPKQQPTTSGGTPSFSYGENQKKGKYPKHYNTPYLNN